MNYQGILDSVKEFIADHYAQDVKLDDYVSQSIWSRRQIQRALSAHNTGWRELLAEARK